MNQRVCVWSANALVISTRRCILSRLITEAAIVALAASKDVADEALAAEKAVGRRLSAPRLTLQRGFK
jgi:hypothetical protein